jgi:putative transcriptional regulator
MKGRTDWVRLKAMTEKEIIAAAKADLNAPLLTANQLKQFKRVFTPKAVDVKKTREELGFSQKEFADYFGVSIRTVQEWEQHRRTPTATARNFLMVIAREPQAVQYY